MRWLLILAGLVGCTVGPFCEERGGRLKFSHYTIISTGKSIILIPNYRCEIP